MDGFLLPGARSHYSPDLALSPIHTGKPPQVKGVRRRRVLDVVSDRSLWKTW